VISVVQASAIDATKGPTEPLGACVNLARAIATAVEVEMSLRRQRLHISSWAARKSDHAILGNAIVGILEMRRDDVISARLNIAVFAMTPWIDAQDARWDSAWQLTMGRAIHALTCIVGVAKPAAAILVLEAGA